MGIGWLGDLVSRLFSHSTVITYGDGTITDTAKYGGSITNAAKYGATVTDSAKYGATITDEWEG